MIISMSTAQSLQLKLRGTSQKRDGKIIVARGEGVSSDFPNCIFRQGVKFMAKFKEAKLIF